MQKTFEGSLENRPREAIAFTTSERLSTALQSALLDLKGDRLMSAAGHEKSARDTLWRLVMILQPSQDPLDKLLDGLGKLDQLIAGEKEVIRQTDDLDNKERIRAEELVLKDARVVNLAKQIADMERGLENARPEEQVRIATSMEKTRLRLEREIEKARQRLGVDTPEMSDLRRAERAQREQAEIVDRTDFLGQELSGVAPVVSTLLADAVSIIVAHHRFSETPAYRNPSHRPSQS